jgi:hypothetical protein
MFLCALAFAKQDARHALEVRNRAAHRASDRSDCLETRIRSCTTSDYQHAGMKDTSLRFITHVPTEPANATRPWPGLSP